MCLLGAALASTPQEKKQAALEHKLGSKRVSAKKIASKKTIMKKRG